MAASFETQPGSSEVATEDGEELLSEELEAVSAAYPEAARWIHARRVLSVELPALTLRLHVPAGYPTEPPSATMDTRVGVTVTEVDDLKAELQDTISMADGDMVLLPCIAVAEGASQEWQEAHSSAPEAVEAAAPATTEAQRAGTCVSSVPCPPIVHGDPVVERKSTFLGHAAEVHSVEEVQAVMRSLLSDRHIARATHNMMAYRFTDSQGVLHSDNDEDGEDAAGGRMSMLLEMMDVTQGMVVVTRWYGGVLLGPSRFKLINNTAREVLIQAGLSGRDADKS